MARKDEASWISPRREFRRPKCLRYGRRTREGHGLGGFQGPHREAWRAAFGSRPEFSNPCSIDGKHLDCVFTHEFCNMQVVFKRVVFLAKVGQQTCLLWCSLITRVANPCPQEAPDSELCLKRSKSLALLEIKLEIKSHCYQCKLFPSKSVWIWLNYWSLWKLCPKYLDCYCLHLVQLALMRSWLYHQASELAEDFLLGSRSIQKSNCSVVGLLQAFVLKEQISSPEVLCSNNSNIKIQYILLLHTKRFLIYLECCKIQEFLY